MGYIVDLSSTANLRKLVLMLPFELKRDWGKRVVELNHQPLLSEFRDWLGEQERIALNCFNSNKQGTVDSTNVASMSKPCFPDCHGVHRLTDCHTHLARTEIDRALTKTAGHKLCFNWSSNSYTTIACWGTQEHYVTRD